MNLLLSKIRTYNKLITVICLVGIILLICIPISRSVIAHSYKTEEVFISDTDIAEGKSDSDVKLNAYYSIDSDAVEISSDSGEIKIYGQYEETWNFYNDDVHFNMKAKYYANALSDVSGDTFEDIVLNKSMYIVSSEVFLYNDLLEDATYDVYIGKDSSGRDVAVVSYSFSNDIDISFSYNTIADTPVKITKNSEFLPIEIRYYAWLMNPAVGVCARYFHDGEYIITTI